MNVLIIAGFAISIQAQQKTTARASVAVDPIPSGTPPTVAPVPSSTPSIVAAAPSGTPPAKPAASSSEPSEREKMLLERIEKLEKRLSDMESRDAVKASADPAQPNASGVATATSSGLG